MRPAAAVCATIGGAFVAGAAVGLLAQRVGLVPVWVALLLGACSLALVLAGLRAFKDRPRRR